MDIIGRNDVLAIRRDHNGSNVTLSFDDPICMVRAFGCKMYSDDGKEYLDCVNNVAHVGHCEPSVVKAQQEQLAILNTNARYLSHAHAAYTKALLARLPDQLSVVYFTNSGSEANDLALRISRAARPRCRHVAVMEGAYHGHVISMIDCSPYKFWGPGGNGRSHHVHVLPLPDSYRQTHLDGAASARAVIAEVEAEGEKIAALFCESALSCGGQILLPDGYLKGVYDEMRRHGAVCIADEVQCGFGRCGLKFWAFCLQDVIPDIIVMGKAMGNGFPLAGVVTTPALAQAFATGTEYFNTFGGNNVACATGLAVLHAIDRLQLVDNARVVGEYLLSQLKALSIKWPDTLGDVRGMGLFIGIEVVHDRTSKTHAPGKAKWIKEQCKARKVLLSTDGPWGNVLKIKPPMVFTIEDADQLTMCLADVLLDMDGSMLAIAGLDANIIKNVGRGQQQAKSYFANLALQ